MFTAKQARAFDPEIAGYIERSGVERELERLLDRAFDYRIVSLRWEENVDVRVEGALDPLFEATARSAEGHHHVGESVRRPHAHGDDGAPPPAAAAAAARCCSTTSSSRSCARERASGCSGASTALPTSVS